MCWSVGRDVKKCEERCKGCVRGVKRVWSKCGGCGEVRESCVGCSEVCREM